MRPGALLVAFVLVLGIAGCSHSTPIKPASAPQSGGGDSTAMFDPPLSVPPGFNAPPLEAAAATTQQQQPADSGDQSQAGASDPAAGGQPSSGAAQTAGEQAFLQAAGANAVNPNIRAQIDAANRPAVDQDFIDQLVTGPNPSATAPGLVIQRRSPAVLDTIF